MTWNLRIYQIAGLAAFLGYIVCRSRPELMLLGVILALNVPTIVPFLEQLLGFQVMPGDVYYVTRIPSELEKADVVTIALAAFVLTSLATLYPARRAALVNPAAALRYE